MTKNMILKERIEELEKENAKLKEEVNKERNKTQEYDSSGWDFHWDGRGSYEEARRCFYGDFS